MKQVVIPWTNGTGNITLTFTGQGNDTVIVASDDNSLDVARSQAITVKTADGSVRRTVIVTQEAGSHSQPYDAEVEYLESSKTQFINTMIITTEAHRIKLSFSYSVTGNTYDYSSIFGCGISNSTWLKTDIKSSTIIGVQAGGPSTETKITINPFNIINMDFDIQSRYVVVNGTSYAVRGTTIPTDMIYLFMCKNITSSLASGKIYHFEIFDDNNIHIANFIPVRVGNIGYMYDKVSKQLFGNSGTGDFILGPDIK